MTGFEAYDVVKRSSGKGYGVSDHLTVSCFAMAHEAMAFCLSEAYGRHIAKLADPTAEAEKFKRALDKARSDKLLHAGGVPERNFLALYLIAMILKPRTYVESGFFKGSSLFAVAASGGTQSIIGLDPIHSNYRADLSGCDVDLTMLKNDFADFQPENVDERDVVYFDDHINTAHRIIQASDKGFRTLVFDDSCGLTGTVERMWPSLPSLFFILNFQRLREGDWVEWPKKLYWQASLLSGRMELSILRKTVNNRFEITRDVIELCKEANARIRVVRKLPDLSDFVPTRRKIAANDVTQHLVVLHPN